MEGRIMSFNEQRLKDILKEYDQDLYMVFGGDKQIKVSDIDPRDLFSRVTQWSNLSRRGLLCGIMLEMKQYYWCPGAV